MNANPNRRTIAVVTTSRADYSHLYWVLRELREAPDVDLRDRASVPAGPEA